MRSKLRELRCYPLAMAGLGIIVLFVGFCIYTMIAIPHSEGIRLRRGGPGVWDEHPRSAAPVWKDWFTREKLPRTIVVSLEDKGQLTVEPVGDDMSRVEILLPFGYHYNGFPGELSLFLEATFSTNHEIISVSMRKPNGETVTLNDNLRIRKSQVYRISQDVDLHSHLGDTAPHVGLFVDNPLNDTSEPLQGSYELVLQSEWPVGSEFLEAKLVVYGQVYGLAGTDHMRRDIFILALSLGAPIGLIFGVLAAVLLIMTLTRKSKSK